MNKTMFTQALRGLTTNPARTMLTTLGIIIGIATVILVLSAGAGFKSYINSQLEAYGANTVFVETRVPPTTKARSSGNVGAASADIGRATSVAITTLKNRDIESILRTPNVSGAYGAVIGQKTASYQDVSKNAPIFGAGAARFDIDKGVLAAGRPYTVQEDAGAAQVAILGSSLAVDLFGNANPVGKLIRVGDLNFQVIGVYEPRGGLAFSGEDEQVYIPLNTAQKKLLGIDYLLMVVVQLRDQNLAEATAADITQAVRQNHGITDPGKDDFLVMTQAQGLETFNTILSGVTFLLIAIAAISLLVGGVGIMNIMYVVVTERISEIGLKKALGAKNRDILGEFLIESVLLTVVGGAAGILLGSGMAWLVAAVAKSFNFAWSFIVPLSGIILGLGVAGSIGLIFGAFPAHRASKLDPIEALRSE